jgi:hypothetical protein
MDYLSLGLNLLTILDNNTPVNIYNNNATSTKLSLNTHLVESESRGRGAVATANTRANTDNLGVDGARNAVVKLDVQLGDGIDYTLDNELDCLLCKAT